MLQSCCIKAVSTALLGIKHAYFFFFLYDDFAAAILIKLSEREKERESKR